ncbi:MULTISPECIES: hypothetical protein [Mycobacteroides]|uniref:Uncharacterized protein n=2 Tax=Mycobacteroides TaxID=670516 RepID=A0ABR5LIF4_9MYCO|nr:MULTISPECIES: hypothetical protein [Mycobacteroides]KPG20334.1 hypothetical protein AN912_30040 [Mycobacteroides immunogenum]ORB55313.1 hypothetical protein BST43_15735 [Mycobacteroides saopaulense]SKN58829.1 Uncharacterised protein [Mycobacteroides abscessus subsp. massiliense]SKR65162.1 Uncharacterised protein [Mycobacteroides abscessus subsp. abscessus]SLH53341.1 Uncharacterised protein [Mycobacteroides abscessus subsp. massiliense]
MSATEHHEEALRLYEEAQGLPKAQSAPLIAEAQLNASLAVFELLAESAYIAGPPVEAKAPFIGDPTWRTE